jgi:predicted MFS family arabinose efflux permease
VTGQAVPNKTVPDQAVPDQAVPSPRPGWRRYEPAWSARPVRRAFAGTLIARTAQTMMPLTLLLVFRQRMGSFAAAGIAVAVYGVASMAGGPVTARLADRRGARVLAGAGAVSAAWLIVLAITASPVLSWIAVTAAGLSVPPLTSALRATIVANLEAVRDRAAAFSLDAIATELLFIAGPVLVAGAAALGRTCDALLAAGGLVVTGSVLIARTGARRVSQYQEVPAPAAARSARSGHARFLAPWLTVSAAQMAATGFVEVAATARVIQFGDPAAAGTVLAVWAAGSVAGGLTYGSRDWPGPATGQLRLLLLLLATGFAIVAAAENLAVLYPLMFAAGLASAPAATALATSFSAHADRTEDFAWLASSASLGGSAGYAVAGLLMAHITIASTVLLGAALPAVTAVVVPPSARSGPRGGRLR